MRKQNPLELIGMFLGFTGLCVSYIAHRVQDAAYEERLIEDFDERYMRLPGPDEIEEDTD